ncbi:MAG: adenylyltransferase/cytidyltransferase family protein [Candidatus Neomarinimicrobiota bacterium]
MSSLKLYETISKESSLLRKQGKQIVFTNGCFDLIHQGHKDLLHNSSKFGDILIVGLNSDKSVKNLKGAERPMQTASERSQSILKTGLVHRTYIFHEPTPLELINAIRPDILVKGGDYVKNDIVGSKEVLSWGGIIKIVPITPGFSTTNTIKKMRRQGLV